MDAAVEFLRDLYVQTRIISGSAFLRHFVTTNLCGDGSSALRSIGLKWEHNRAAQHKSKHKPEENGYMKAPGKR
jgi:hypothetical protein